MLVRGVEAIRQEDHSERLRIDDAEHMSNGGGILSFLLFSV